MVKINPEFDEPIRERIASTLVAIIDRIEESPSKHSDEIIKRYIQNYYERRKPTIHSFSNDLLDFLKQDVILITIDVNKEYFESTSQKVMDELVSFLIDLFIDEFSKYRDNIELSDAYYLVKLYRLYYYIEKFRSSDKIILDLENWLKKNLDNKWNNVQGYYQEFKNNKISGFQFLKFGIESCGEEEFANALIQFPKLQQYIQSKSN
ncbi:MAG: hypothetical protein GF317_20065 [Candidatus Lokiarchaeota archaeon]|nr:hypothetical protein [Candidatus Lokiarchaeota archaeon]MBD3201778.1 hypothetical protein [Candidatus Lokiarchaeota archaeon]